MVEYLCRASATSTSFITAWNEDVRLDFREIELIPSRLLTREEALYRMPAMQSKNLAGAVAYADGQFDDAATAWPLSTRLTVWRAALNYARVTTLNKTPEGKIVAAVVTTRFRTRPSGSRRALS